MLLFSSVFFFSSINCVNAENLPGVVIQADGTVQGTSSIRRSGDVYTVIEDFNGPLRVEKDNIVIDGAGHTVTGGKGRGIVLEGRRGVTLKNTRVTLDGGYVVDVKNAEDCMLQGNTLVGTPRPIPDLPPPQTLIGPIGVNFLYSQRITVKDNVIQNFSHALSLDCSSGHTITGNTLIDGIVGLDLSNTTGCVFRNNRIINSSFGIQLFSGYGYENDLDTSNKIDSKPIYYWVNQRDKSVPSDAAYVVLVNCANMKVDSVNPGGIALASTVNSAISKVKIFSRGCCVELIDCSGINISDSILRGHGIGIRLQGSSGNVISHNEISNFTTCGVNLGSGNNNVVSGNTFLNNSKGISPPYETAPIGNVIASNNFTGNEWAMTAYGSTRIEGNVFEENSYGIGFSGGSSSIVTGNAFVTNEIALYFSDSSGNAVYLNNFMGNAQNVVDAGASNQTSLLAPAKSGSDSAGSVQLAAFHVDRVNFFPPPPPSVNSWDNGAQGNYWSDYTGIDSNGDGIGDTAYKLYVNNEDRFPLMEAVSLADLPAPPDEQSLPPHGAPPVQESTETDSSGTQTETDQIPWLPVAAVSVLVVAMVAVAAVVYLKKRRHLADAVEKP